MIVPWISKHTISERASRLIKNYQNMAGYQVAPPIPVEDIIERYLEIGISIEDLGESLGMEDVLGATYVNSRMISIDEKLLDDRSEGRLIFTCAHEAGHWVLHRQFVSVAGRSGGQNDYIICRANNAREPIEWQADYFAACLLMPENNVRNSFFEVFGEESIVLENIKSSLGGTSIYVDPCAENWHFLASMVCEAGGFTNVSKHAMAIRLQELFLLINQTGVQLNWGTSRLNS
jgi:hypothetical protein